ncbi:cupin-like domain-containing protein [Nonlabens ulvanivorans]|uniref:Cupin n=2 Tax=Nonlabens ulvanivorans TaxID=906888 RepID=A0A084JUF1_NONUL|nr:cupin-like domain-containing protein [Nonlabens ulvanivorans]KEZ92585.1 cupin [Nonlabens ulvanivorans]PRX15425.1 Cupin-like domain-containing protein [Nonlabens ulvanivorans]
MQQLNLKDIPRVRTMSKEDFVKNHLKPQRPVVIEKLTEDWPAYQKWNLEYIKEVAGDKTVPLYDDRPVKHDEGFNQAHAEMKMADYVDLLKSKPTNFRIFLYNILSEVPILQGDFKFPKLGMRLIKGLPMMFFGGTDSRVFMHYDIDFTNILHFHFHGKKRCIIFPPDQSKFLYRVPHSLIAREDINFTDPDFEKWPALKQAQGYVCELNHGEMLYMPEGYWHFMHYLTPGFSISLRSYPRKLKNLGKALYNLGFMRYYDNYMRRKKGQDWIDYKNEQAVTRTHKKLNIKK